MFSTEKRHMFYVGGDQGFGFMGYGYKNCSTGEAAFISSGSDIVVSPPILMAEEESPRNNQILPEGEKSNSRDDQDWLQLGIGGRTLEDQKSRKSGTNPVELELMPNSSSSNINKNGGDHLQMRRPLTGPVQDLQAPRSMMINNYAAINPTFFSQQQFYNPRNSSWTNLFPQHHQEWGVGPQFRPINTGATSSSFTNPPCLASPSNYFPPLEMMPHRPAIDFRVTQPPRRPYSAGIWFMLQALQNQAKEPFYPQIPKRYLRIKDSKMTVLLVMKYLVNKLKLENESEIEIICTGQRLQPFLTLQHVRDNIWTTSSSFVTLLPNSSTTDHIMVLHYGRTADDTCI